MKILITGANGMFAKAIIKTFAQDNKLICTDVEELDITDEKAVNKYIKTIQPNYIINCAAFTAVDKAEITREIAEKVNAEGPKLLAKAAKNNDAILIHISTDYVFSGNLDINKSYKEDDLKDPVTTYGITKLTGEKNIQVNTDKYYIFRTAWLYGDGNNFVRTILKLGKTKRQIHVVSDQHGSPTYTEDLAQIIKQAIEKNIPYGVYNATDEGYTTWYEFAKTIFKYKKINCKINPVTTEEYIKMMNIIQAKRPKNSQMSKEKLKNAGIQIPRWQDALKTYLKKESI